MPLPTRIKAQHPYEAVIRIRYFATEDDWQDIPFAAKEAIEDRDFAQAILSVSDPVIERQAEPTRNPDEA